MADECEGLGLEERGEQTLHLQVACAARTLAPMFRTFGWEWLTTSGVNIPTEAQIQEQLDHMVCSLLDDTEMELCAAGRLFVHKDLTCWDEDEKLVAIFLQVA